MYSFYCFILFFLFISKTNIIYVNDFFSNNIFLEGTRKLEDKYKKKNIYSYEFYLDPKVRINTTFSMGSTQGVLYLNYPFSFADETTGNLEFKNLNSSGMVILKTQPKDVTVSNLPTQKGIVPMAYITLQEVPFGWCIYTPADYYEGIAAGAEEVTKLSFYNNSIYLGRKCGPSYQVGTFNNPSMTGKMIKDKIEESGIFNVCLGNQSSNYASNKNISYNTVIGSRSGSLLTGSYNTFIGTMNGFGPGFIVNTRVLEKDYYSRDNSANYNNCLGFANLGINHRNSHSQFVSNKQNNIFGNLNMIAAYDVFRNCIFGNRILSTIINNITQFHWIDSNIIIGNDIFHMVNSRFIEGLYGNIILLPHGGLAVQGGIEVNSAFGADTQSGEFIQSNFCIMLGSVGSRIAYERSYKTFIANIYHSSLTNSPVPLSTADNTAEDESQDAGFIGRTSFPVVVCVNNVDQLGQMQVVPYGKIDPEKIENSYKNQKGNVFDIDAIVRDYLFSKEEMPIMGIAFENTESATKNGLLFTVDTYSMVGETSCILSEKNNPLSAFIIYTSDYHKVPYSFVEKRKESSPIRGAEVGYPRIAGYEHYYLIPVLVRGCQILHEDIEQLKDSIGFLEEQRMRGINPVHEEKILDCQKKIDSILDIQKNLILFLLSEDKNREVYKKKLKKFLKRYS